MCVHGAVLFNECDFYNCWIRREKKIKKKKLNTLEKVVECNNEDLVLFHLSHRLFKNRVYIYIFKYTLQKQKQINLSN